MEVLYTEVLDETADSIEAIPGKNYFTCGTYQLMERNTDTEPAKRCGSLILYKIDNMTVTKIQSLCMNAILDMKWHSKSHSILTVADSCGNALYYSLHGEKLKKEAEISLDDNALCLSVDWCKTESPDEVIYSLSSGHLCLVKYAESVPTIIRSWKGHSLETWIVAADYQNKNLFYSGADDCFLRLWDVRVGVNKPCFSSKQHMMGVCSLQTSKHQSHLFCSGSYDETIVVWDNRSMRKPLSITETDGGVWRLKWHPVHRNVLLAACMHNGFQLISYNEDFTHSDILYSYDKHESLAYGVDWCFSEGEEQLTTVSLENIMKHAIVGCCSFYDKFLSVFTFK